MQTVATRDVDSIIDGRPLGHFQISLISWCAMLMGIDGYDLQLAAYTAPALIKAWGIDKATFGPVFGAGLTGYLVGALLLSMVGDRYGRRPVILWSTLVFGIVTLATVTAGSREALMVYRFIACIGLGGSIANIVALMAEYSPARRRAMVVGLLFAGYTCGAALGGALAAVMIPKSGWESAFILGGALPLVLLPLLVNRLPESIRLLVAKGGDQSLARSLMGRVAPEENFAHASFTTAREAQPKLPVKALFRPRYILVTCVLWISFVMSFLGHHFITNWLPTLLDSIGVPLTNAVMAGSLLHAGAFVGSVLMALTVDRRGIVTVAMAYLLAVPFIIGIGVAGSSPVLSMPLIFATGICLIGGQAGLNAVAAMIYDTQIRATGTGWALGIGRIGAIFGPLAGGWLLAAGVQVSHLFYWAALPVFTCALMMLFLNYLIRQAGSLELNKTQ